MLCFKSPTLSVRDAPARVLVAGMAWLGTLGSLAPAGQDRSSCLAEVEVRWLNLEGLRLSLCSGNPPEEVLLPGGFGGSTFAMSRSLMSLIRRLASRFPLRKVSPSSSVSRFMRNLSPVSAIPTALVRIWCVRLEVQLASFERTPRPAESKTGCDKASLPTTTVAEGLARSGHTATARLDQPQF